MKIFEMFVREQYGDVAVSLVSHLVCELRHEIQVLFVQDMARVGHGNVFRRRLAVDRALERRAEEQKPSRDDGKEEDEEDPEAAEPRQTELQSFVDVGLRGLDLD